MKSFICETCGVAFAPSPAPPARCAICDEPRQYVPPSGQRWTDMAAVAAKHMNAFRSLEEGLIGFASQPAFAIGQRALLVRTSIGLVLWDCVSLLDAATIDIVRGLGGLAAIAISHPHYYSTMVDWAQAFDAPVFLHADDQRWIMRPDPAIRLWDGETLALAPDLTLIRCGGHFAGATVAHWPKGAGGEGALLAGDVVMTVPDRTHVSFMRSYPNMLPLSAPAVERIGAALEPFAFEAIYGAFFGRDVARGGKAAVRRSVARYVAAVRGDGSAERT